MRSVTFQLDHQLICVNAAMRMDSLTPDALDVINEHSTVRFKYSMRPHSLPTLKLLPNLEVIQGNHCPKIHDNLITLSPEFRLERLGESPVSLCGKLQQSSLVCGVDTSATIRADIQQQIRSQAH